MYKVSENTQYHPLEGGRGIEQAKLNDLLGKGPQWEIESSIILLFRTELDLIVPLETIHKRKEISSNSFENLINKTQRKVVFICVLIKLFVIN